MVSVTILNKHTLWEIIQQELSTISSDEPALTTLKQMLQNCSTFEVALAHYLAHLLANAFITQAELESLMLSVFQSDENIVLSVIKDIDAYYERDAACDHYLMPFLYFKGFHALCVYRIAHYLYQHEQQATALFLQNTVSQSFAVDIHPAATLGAGIMLDHATGLVIGETTVIEDDVSILHSVTLGGTGTTCDKDRHPKIRKGVLLAAGAKVLGCIEVGEGAKIAAGSLVLEDVPAHTTVAGVPAKIVGKPAEDQPALSMDQNLGK